ncbi:hypothetical protein EMIHUDRAFT_223163 [Emiliania huxleyi CCMP1516]|uniref:PITH domain-containing protein n=2 Tax=Emiliania huxleyi TaxID=2903 RepID=A0A0D3KW25_EMIH1|nr:hypothetical protein EMIHUDRAFT_223163 [Emiliania huxleyi CCMP1516]EOD39960.1 hypothetical protein EMIHUDRAFT_223163 [Emiliania huxleyi CCMP1516]|eukprot:XP_005792389.1 hypothetical protein EMIHUDRAFT_223163 [Emiliania huxleyi CCMP1516]
MAAQLSHYDLFEQLELPQCECLNAAKDHTLRRAPRRPPRRFTLHMLTRSPAPQAVRLSAIVVAGPAASAPSELRIFANPPAPLDFDSGRSNAPTQTLPLTPADVAREGRPVELRFVHFQGAAASIAAPYRTTVRELTIFVPGNMGNEEETVIARLRLIGLPVEQTGAKRSEAEQAAASKADWLGSGIRGA